MIKIELNDLAIGNQQSVGELDLGQEQTKFMETTIGKALNFGIDIGIRSLLPNAIEGTVINMKDNILENGLKDGVTQMVSDVIDTGKELVGFAKGGFKDVEQVKDVLMGGDVMQGVSGLLDVALTAVKPSGQISQTMVDAVKGGKDLIFNSIENSFEQSFKNQVKTVGNIEKAMEKWETAFKEQNVKNMDKHFDSIQSELKNILPLENLILKTREIGNVQELIKNNGNNFDLSEQQLNLAKKF